jgi:hypothetical protein
MNQITTRHIYQIHVKKCAEAYIQKLEQLEIEEKVKNRLITEVKTAVDLYHKNIHKVNSIIGIKEKDVNFISTRHMAFNFWFALFLNTKTPATIPLILDAYEKGEFGNRFYGYDNYTNMHIFDDDNWASTQNFIGNLQHRVLKILDNKVLNSEGIDPFRFHSEAISNWIRERKSTLSKSSYKYHNTEYTSKLIETQLPYEKVINYFMVLYTTKNKFGEPFVDEKDVIYFIQSNFRFLNTHGLPKNYKILPKKKIKTSLKKCHLTRLVYHFQYNVCKYNFKTKISDYCMLILHNFYDNYTSKTFESLKTNFSRDPAKTYPFR